MKLAECCNVGHSYIGEIEIGRKFPSMDLIEKIAKTLRIEPYLFFKSRTGKSSLAEIGQETAKMPYSSKKTTPKTG
jgi:transcriptional regulator with XRE-family HTH domain